jgi:penicillin-binding protein 2
MRDAEFHDSATRRRFGVLALLFSICFVLLLGRLFQVQIIDADQYRERSRTSFTRAERVPARRGEIRDRNGVILARNTPTWALSLIPHEIREAAVREPLLRRLAELLELTWEDVETLEAAIVEAIRNDEAWHPVSVKDSLVGDNCPHDGTPLELVNDDKAPRDADRSHQLFCHVCGLHHEPLDAKTDKCPHDGHRLEFVGEGANKHGVCGRCKRTYVQQPICPHDGGMMTAVDRNLLCPTCKRRFTNEVAVIKSLNRELKGVRVNTALMRDYPKGWDLSHTLGYVNYVTREDREASPSVYAINDRVGRSGLERALEAVLRGRSGVARFLKGADRNVMREYTEPEHGHQVWLTIDHRLQKAVRDILRYQRSAGAVVMEPNTGEILAMYSQPGFDPNQWAGRLSPSAWDAIAKNPYDPLLNKAITPYAPGSVYKIVTSLAALREGIATPETVHHCPGYYEFGGRRFGCHAKQGHGYVDMVAALKGSCDVYFYKVAEALGMDRLATYGHLFGYGEPTGIEVAEGVGLVPTRKWHDDHTTLGFQPGLTLSVGIGQGSLTASPLQVARSFAAVANGGKLVKARLVDRYTDENGELLQRFLPVVERDLNFNPTELDQIRKGLIAVVNAPDGTAKDVADPNIVIAGKTGTAEAPQSRPNADDALRAWLKQDHAWFAMYAPAEAPEVVIVVFLEHGGSGGRDAAPLARRIFDAWLRLGLYRGAGAVDGGDDDAEPPAAPDNDGPPPGAGNPPTVPAEGQVPTRSGP